MAQLRIVFNATDGSTKSRTWGNYDANTINEKAVRDLASLLAATHAWRDEIKNNQYESVASIALIQTT